MTRAAEPEADVPSRSVEARRPASARRLPIAPTFRRSSCPTTYAGSEVTPILGQTEGGRRKTTLRERRRSCRKSLSTIPSLTPRAARGD